MALSAKIVAGALAIATFSACSRGSNAPPPAPEVTVATPISQNVTDYLEFTGNTAPINSASLVARVEGYLEKVSFEDGSFVKKGDLLFTIQQDQYKAQLEQARAQVEAQEAAYRHASIELVRFTNLNKQKAAAQTVVDQWLYEKQKAAAGLASAKAQVEIAELNLSYTEVRAPFAGRMGRHLVNPGNLVGSAGQATTLAEIDQIDPIYVYFTISERDLLRILARRKDAAKRALKERDIPAYFALLNEEGWPHQGRLDFASINVTPTTGTLQLRGIFENSEMTVLPGLFVHVRVPIAERRDALLIPGDAVAFDQQGEYVLVVNARNIVERRAIKTGAQIAESLVIESGLRPGDRVIVEGLLQAIVGRAVTPVPAAAKGSGHDSHGGPA